MQEETRKIVSLGILIFIIGAFAGFTFNALLKSKSSSKITGLVVSQNGQLNQVDGQSRGNPNYGALSGTLQFTISDGSGNIISTDSGANYELFFSRHTISNWALVKNNTEDFSGTLTSVDADSSSSTCSSSTYTTRRMWYDEDNDDAVDESEFYIYAIPTDSHGCYAIKLPPGSYDIYG